MLGCVGEGFEDAGLENLVWLFGIHVFFVFALWWSGLRGVVWGGLDWFGSRFLKLQLSRMANQGPLTAVIPLSTRLHAFCC